MNCSNHWAGFACLMFAAIWGCAKQHEAELKTVRGQTVEHWLNELKRPEPNARISAVGALQSVGAADAAAIPALIGALADPDATVRDATVIAILNIGPPAKDAVSALNKAKSDKDATVRSHAEAALKRLGAE